MNARIAAWFESLGNQFWLRPALVVVFCICVAEAAIWVETAQPFNSGGPDAAPWGYSGGAEGARALLGAVASSSIGVAGTVFSITIAALSLASSQMGPRLLRNFVRDSRNQFALGIFVGTFAYALVVVRTVRSQDEGAFVPHAAVTGGIVLAVVCIATLVWFVHHIATSINVERVVEAVYEDLVSAIEDEAMDDPDVPSVEFEVGEAVAVGAHGYLQVIDGDGLADWAEKNKTRVRLLVRPGEYIQVGLPVAEISPAREGASDAIGRALTFGRQQVSLQDLEFSVRQLTEIAVRALSPGINDPFTAGSVLERLADALCLLSNRFLPTGAYCRDGDLVLVRPVTDYDGLCDVMFHTIRQNASGSGFVLIRMLDVLTKVAQVESQPVRLASLLRHADFVFETGRTSLNDTAAKADLHHRWDMFQAVASRADKG